MTILMNCLMTRTSKDVSEFIRKDVYFKMNYIEQFKKQKQYRYIKLIHYSITTNVMYTNYTLYYILFKK